MEERKSAERSMFSDDLNANTISDNLSVVLEFIEVRLEELGETVFS